MRRAGLALLMALALAAPVTAQNTTGPGFPPGVTPPIFTASPSSGVTGGGVVTAPQVLFPDGTSGAPAIAFASAPTTGFFLSAPTSVTLAGSGGLIATSLQSNTTINLAAASIFYWATRGVMNSPADGIFALKPNAQTMGVEIKVDALPTIASGFGTAPSVSAGSTPYSGSINIGTGGTATTGVITFNGAAFPSAPFCQASPTTTNSLTRASSSTTQLTLTTTTAWTTGDVVNWICPSAK
jgi:hypothetical protein